jgi:hypothetical protein
MSLKLFMEDIPMFLSAKSRELFFANGRWMIWAVIGAVTSGWILFGVYYPDLDKADRHFTILLGILFCIGFSLYVIYQLPKDMKVYDNWGKRS